MINCERTSLTKYLGTSNIFDIIKGIYSFPFLEPAGQTVTMDQMLRVNYGSRAVFSGFIDITVDDVAKHLISIYKDKWDKAIIAAANINNLAANSSRKIKGTVSEMGTGNTQSDTENKVAAFNSDTLVTDGGTSNTSDNTTTRDTDRESTDETFNLKSLLENLPLVERTNIINIVLKDVSNYLTVSIY